MVQSELIGYVRKSRNGNALNLSISAEAFENAQRYLSQDGKEYVGLIVNLAKVQEILDDSREVTSVCQIKDEAL
ncbi:MAG: hypothetical protein JSV96_00140 [Candidatus Aminicenantes bacterium]|nr:MAG: hypothetical protein JSV96_00140 [Candidatus Aminicenantes bacterium]